MVSKNLADSIVIVMGSALKRGRKTEMTKIVVLFWSFRFLSPTKLNRDERVTCSEARSIQPLCLVGVVPPSKMIIVIDFNAVADCF